MRHYPPRAAPHPGGHRSPNRNRALQARFRREVLARDGHACRLCGRIDLTGSTLEAHHVRPGYNAADGVTVCNAATNGCHRKLDPYAR